MIYYYNYIRLDFYDNYNVNNICTYAVIERQIIFIDIIPKRIIVYILLNKKNYDLFGYSYFGI